MPLPDFHVSEPFTLGIELEMQVVNPPGYDLSQDSSMLIDTVKKFLNLLPSVLNWKCRWLIRRAMT